MFKSLLARFFFPPCEVLHRDPRHGAVGEQHGPLAARGRELRITFPRGDEHLHLRARLVELPPTPRHGQRARLSLDPRNWSLVIVGVILGSARP